MDTSYEEPGLSSQYEEFGTSPYLSENKLNCETSTSPNIPSNNVNTNVLSPFSSLTSRIVAPNPSVPVKKFQGPTQSECSDTDEEFSGAEGSVAQSSSANLPGNRTNQTHAASRPETCSQGSSSTFSPFSSPVSSPRSEITELKQGTSSSSSRQASTFCSGTFLHPGTSNTINIADREKFDRSASKRQCFIHPSSSENVKNNQNCSDSPILSTTSQDACTHGHRVQSQTRAASSCHANLLKKLMGRETRGAVRKNPSNPRDPQVRLFSRLPARLAFCLRDAIPHSAIENGHIFLGFSKCGQFLLSYTQTEADVDLVTLVPHFHYHYRLHWWLFVPYRRAKKVAEVTLFSNTSAAGNLHISFCQWPKDNHKVLVFGC